MMWGSLGGMFTASAQMDAAMSAHEAQRRYFENYRDSLMQLVPDTRPSPYRRAPVTPAITRPTKCESCGSREFKQHGGQTVCVYCRGAA